MPAGRPACTRTTIGPASSTRSCGTASGAGTVACAIRAHLDPKTQRPMIGIGRPSVDGLLPEVERAIEGAKRMLS
ncbi:MAG: hypothetical protein IT377_13435 [Polyangiaceae bacterium]|nr:hypothetical protein [Polyangiaceae bacterium]